MKFFDKLGLMVFSSLILILSVIIFVMCFGWLDVELVSNLVKNMFNNPTSTNILLGISIVLIALAVKCIFFPSDEKEKNGIRDGIILKNTDGELVISKVTLEELVNNIVKGFNSAQDIATKIVVDNNGGLIVNVIFSVTKDAIIKELSTNLQTKIKTSIKKVSDLEVKEVNISIRNLQERENPLETMNE